MTYDDFLDWADEDTLAEWVDGQIILTSPANRRHQDIARFLLMTLSSFVDVHGLGTVMGAPFQMKLPRSGREPDVLFIATLHLDRLQETYLAGPADLVVEIVSPESSHRDRVVKFDEYQEAGIPEYWLVDPDIPRADFYQLDAHARYQLMAPDSDGMYRSRVLPGFWLRVAWLWQTPLPDSVRVLLQIDCDAYARYLREHLHQEGL